MADEDFYDNVETSGKAAIEEAARLAELLRQASEDVAAAESAYKEAQQAYNKLAQETIPNYYKSIGISKMALDNGTVLSIEEKVTCSPSKAARPELIKWLRDHDGGHLVKETLAVSPEFKTFLKEQNVTFVENGDVNTNALKAWLTRQLGMGSGTQGCMSKEDIPDFVNLYVYNITEIKSL